MITVEQILRELTKFQEYERQGLIPKELKSFKDKSDWVRLH